MATRTHRQDIRVSLFVAFLTVGVMAGRASADVCVTIDETRDTFSPQDRSAAVILLERQFELEGERVVPPGCAAPYVVSHVQLGNVVSITLSGPNGQRDATALGMDDVPAVYSQMVRSLLKGVPMAATGVVDRTNVSKTQSTKRRIYSDSVVYARLGYGGLFADRIYGGPSAAFFGYRKELDAFALDISFFDAMYKTSSSGFASGTSTSWLKLEALHFMTPLSDRSIYAGGGLSWSSAHLDNADTSWRGDGLQGELTVGYELARASTLRVFMQADGGLPFYKLHSESYLTTIGSPNLISTVTSDRYAPTLSLSIGFGWQRGGN